MAPKTSLRDNPPSASSSASSEESGPTAEASGSSEYETSEDEAPKPNGKPSASSSSESNYDSGDDPAKPSGKTDDSSGKAPSQPTKQTLNPVSSSQSESESSDDEAAKPTEKIGGSSSKIPPPPATKKKQQSEERSDSDSETESAEAKSVTGRDLKPVSVSSKSAKQQKPLSASVKRKADKTPDPKSSKRTKLETDEKKLALVSRQDSEKKNPFQRVFTESDEIEILKGTAEFEEQKKLNVVYDANDFYEFIQKRIETKFTKAQLLGKLQTMKKRFPGLGNRVSKGSKTLKPLDRTIYELSNKLWGPGGCLEKSEKDLVVENPTPIKPRKSSPSSKLTKKTGMVEVSQNTNPNAGVTMWYLSENLGICHKGSGVDPDYLREVMDSVDEEERAELESRWRKNQAAMARVVGERSMITQHVCKLVAKHSCSPP